MSPDYRMGDLKAVEAYLKEATANDTQVPDPA